MDDLGVKSWQGQEIFNFSIWSRVATFCSMGIRVLSLSWSSQGLKLTTHLNLVPSLRMSGDVPLLPPICHNGMDRNNIVY